VGTVGVAGGFLLLAGGVAQADDADTTPVNDLRGSLDGFFTPMGPSSLAGGADPAAPLNGVANLSLGGKAVNPTDALGVLGALPLDPTATLDPAGLGAAPATEAGGGTPGNTGLPVVSSLPQFGAVPIDAVRNLDPTELPSVQNFDAGRLLPALIGDSLAAQSPELFTESNSLAMSQSATERPVAGEDADFAESTRAEALEMPALNLPLPLVGNLGGLRRGGPGRPGHRARPG
jgi:hypothetical protein